MKAPRLACVTLLIALALPGCKSTAFTVGVGFGAGAEVRLSGILHAGALAFFGCEWGSVYGFSPELFNLYGTLGLLHYETSSFTEILWQHYCLGVLPGVASGGENHHPWAFELGVALGLVHFRLGWDPTESEDDAPPREPALELADPESRSGE